MSDELKPLPPDLQALLDVEREAPAAPTAARARVRERLALSIGAAGLTAAGAAQATPALGTGALKAAPQLAAKALLAKLGLGVAATIGVGLGVHAMVTRPAPAPIVAPAPRVTAPALPSAPVAAPQPEPVVAPIPSAAAPAKPHRRPTGNDLAAERQLLDSAGHALSSGDAAAALSALQRHAARFPDGQLTEECDHLRIRALAAAGRPDAARTRAAEFRARHPRSIFLPAVDATLQSLP
jgi:hypothetical protein